MELAACHEDAPGAARLGDPAQPARAADTRGAGPALEGDAGTAHAQRMGCRLSRRAPGRSGPGRNRRYRRIAQGRGHRWRRRGASRAGGRSGHPPAAYPTAAGRRAVAGPGGHSAGAGQPGLADANREPAASADRQGQAWRGHRPGWPTELAASGAARAAGKIRRRGGETRAPCHRRAPETLDRQSKPIRLERFRT